MKKEWQQAKPWAQYAIKPIFLNNEIGVKMLVINRENELIFQTKQTGKDIDEAYTKAKDECLNKLSDVDLRTIFWYNPYMLGCKDIKTPYYESKKRANITG